MFAGILTSIGLRLPNKVEVWDFWDEWDSWNARRMMGLGRVLYIACNTPAISK